MVLQGDTSLRIWGWAAVREKVVMSIQGKTHSAAAAPRGEWQVLLPAQKASDPLER